MKLRSAPRISAGLIRTKRGDVDAVVSYYTDDAAVMVPNRPVVTGKQAARELIRSQLETPGYSGQWEPEEVRVARSGDPRLPPGNYSVAWTDPNASPVTDTGKYIVIWRKQPDRNWKVAVDILNSDRPPVPLSQPPRPGLTMMFVPDAYKAQHWRWQPNKGMNQTRATGANRGAAFAGYAQRYSGSAALGSRPEATPQLPLHPHKTGRSPSFISRFPGERLSTFLPDSK